MGKVLREKKSVKSKVLVDLKREGRGNNLKLPHIFRFFTARFFYDVFLALLIFFVLGIVAFNFLYPTNSFEAARLNLLLHPTDAYAYMKLADSFLEVNDFKGAKREFGNAVFFAKSSAVAAEAQKKILAIEKNEKSKDEIESEIKKWEKVSLEKPNYRDAYFRLAVLNYQLYKNEESKQFIEKALKLDPNFEDGKALRDLL